ncbi:MAG: DnaJ domain-containing protein [Poseidonibacter sp.]|uniref:DnaJ domain-containing protein n=1 Tax=Poseidonibacter sp. TaxID=2321188 RepID=UPI00359EAEED
MNLKKLIFLAIFLVFFYYVFIVNIFLTLSIVLALYIAFKLYKYNARRKLNKLAGSKELFKASHLGHFIALVAKVAKADGTVQKLEAQLIGMMFDDISKVFDEKEKARAIMKEIFNEEKENNNNTKEIALELNALLGRSILKRRQFISFLIQLAFVDNGISKEEDIVLRDIATALNIAPADYDAIVNKFENMKNNQTQTMSPTEAYKVLGVNENDDMSIIKNKYRKLVRKYHPDIISSQDKDESYMEEATAKTQEINQAYQIIKEMKKKRES